MQTQCALRSASPRNHFGNHFAALSDAVSDFSEKENGERVRFLSPAPNPNTATLQGALFLLSPKSDGCDFLDFEQRDDLEDQSPAKRTHA